MKFALILATGASAAGSFNEVFDEQQTAEAGYDWRGNATAVSSHVEVHDLLHKSLISNGSALPDDFNWCNHPDGNSYCTMSRNQHIPQYCGSCWAHGSVSALADRVKIARKAQGVDINPSVQHILNCGGGGSCHGGSVDGPYQWLHRISKQGAGISYESSNPYMACSSEMGSALCKSSEWTCEPINIARTCSTFGVDCAEITPYPNIQIDDYGSIRGVAAMQSEIFARGPIACGIDAAPILNYTAGVATMRGRSVDHVVSVTGWGVDAGTPYWHVRNSWGEYWGEFGYIRVAFGALQLEQQCAWASPSYFTAPEAANQVHCFEGGENCATAK
ncbi:hypothetical protein M885DRAFT_549557 [Pelagophyceae sp. CCMP2097]|nr:hypothetical protein M885DRAFT_549557 [Pelagophyceae sp. CCMP2097]|eukprot:CAMPEP_0184083058 /NCGR_PEP_ID=MMETSP0974-20121125/3516_1 /TAXON_ID=483370 /ORGANISM="non described non described, Strain CCMP2097" /LENGTH=331 /DNA_ID=CAMNT_0026385733 /DNA_START=75 /DNA_END=1073 /DNA_ORIENTATION=+